MSIYNRIDAVMIERMLGERGAEQAGIYAASYRILDFFNMIGFAFATILLPMFARMIKQKQDVSKLLVISGRVILSISLMVACACGFFSKDIMQLLYVDATDYWANVFGLLMTSFIGVSVAYIFGTLLTANGNLREMNLMALGGVIINVLLNLVLIPRHEALGATVATVTTQFLTAIVQIVICVRTFRFAPSGGHVFMSLSFVAVCVGSFWVTSLLDMTWWLGLGLAATVSLLAALALRMIDLRAVKREMGEAS
jgi:O-antigen/teichoic acid export membrane protein